MSIQSNIQTLKTKIKHISKKANRDSEEIQIVVASKYANASQIKNAFDAGVSVFGENRVQELLEKQEQLRDLPIKWHFIGNLQTNKVKKVVGKVELIQSVDSLKLAHEINKRALNASIVQSVLMQVNTSREESKSGVEPSKSLQIAKEIANLDGIDLKGLMGIAPLTDDEEILRRHFSLSKKIFVEIQTELGHGFKWVSMGMSNDFELAIACGSNMLRLGSAIFA